MISSLRGTVLTTTAASAVVEVGGVGFSVQLTPEHALRLRVGDEVFLSVSLIVREDSLSLFGFPGDEQREFFEHLIGVNGVGPKSAMGVLAVMSPDQIRAAVADDDDAAFRTAPGIGPKSAKLIVVSLAGKIAPPVAAQTTAGDVAPDVTESVLSALTGLGWPERAATSAIEKVVADTEDSERSTVPALLRLTLARLGPSGRGTRTPS